MVSVSVGLGSSYPAFKFPESFLMQRFWRGTQHPSLVKSVPKKEMIHLLYSYSPLPVYKSNSSRLLDSVSAHFIENDFYVFFQGIDKSVKYKRSEK